MAPEQAGLQFIAQDVNKYISDLTSAAKAEDATGDASAEAAQKVAKHAQAIDDLTSKVGLQKKQFDILTQELLKANDTYGAGSIQAQKKDLALQNLAQTIQKNEREIQGETKALDAEHAALAATTTAGTDAAHATNTLGNEVQQTAKQVKDSGSSFSAWGEIVKGALRTVGSFAVTELGRAAKAVGGFVNDSVGLAGDFQQNMLEFQSVAGKAVDTKGLDQFRDLFLTLGKELPVSTSEVQQAAIEMVKGGIDPAIIASGGLRQNIQFAAAAMSGDLVGAAEISSKILGGWAAVGATAADKAAFLTHATDQLTKAANASSVDVKELSLGIFNSQGIAKAAGVSFDDLTTTLAELAPRFASSSEAGTSLKNMIARLTPQTKAQTSAMDGLGLYTEATGSKFYDAQGNFVGFQQASQLLQESLKGLTKEQQTTALQIIFGNDAMSAASALAELGSQGYADMAASLTNANGVSEAAALKQQGYNTALENAKGSVEALQITIGSALLPILTDLMNNVIAPAVNTFTTMASAISGSDEAFAQLSPSAQAVVSTIGVLVADVQEIIGAFNEAGAGSSEFGESIGVLASDLGLPGQLIEDIVFATQGLIASFSDGGHAAKQLGGVVTDLNGIWQIALKTVTDVGDGYLAIAHAVLPIVAAFWTAHGTQISTFLTTTYATINRIVTTGLQLYDAVVPPVLQAIAGFFRTHGTAIASILSGAYNVIAGIVTGGLALIEGVITTALDLIHGNWSKAWADIQTMSATFVTALGQVIKGGLELIAGFFGTSLAEIGATWQHNWDALIEIAMKVGARMVAAGASMIQGIIKGVEDEAGALYRALETMARNAFDRFMTAIAGGSPALEFVPAGASIIQGIAKGLENTMPGLFSLVDAMAGRLIDQIGKVSSDVGNKISDMVQKIEDQVTQAKKAIANLTISGFGMTVSVDEQKLSNLDTLDKLTGNNKQRASSALSDAEAEAKAMNDPKQAADYFKMRSDQILRLADLQEQLDNDLTSAQRAQLEATVAQYQKDIASLSDQQKDVKKQLDAATAAGNAAQMATLQSQSDYLTAQISHWQAKMGAAQTQIAGDLTESQVEAIRNRQLLIQDAQVAERKGFAAQAAQGSQTQDVETLIRSIMTASINAKGKTVELPGLAEDPTIRSLYSYLDQLTTPHAPVFTTGGAGSSNSYSQTTNLNMPVYTNQSPSVLQSSLAIAGASLP